MHLVCIVRPGETNEELRYAARSWQQHLPVTSLTTVGHCPAWLTPDQHIPGNRHGRSKQRNVYDNIRIACAHPHVAEELVIMNDDFFILRPTTSIPMQYRCTLDEHIGILGAGWWRESLEAARGWLRGIGHRQPLSYELHRPFPILKGAMQQVLDEAAGICPDNPPQWRTLYGNRWQVPGSRDRDHKVVSRGSRPIGLTTMRYVSTTDEAFTHTSVGELLRTRFTTPSRWER